MEQLQIVFDRIEDTKRKMRDIKKMYKDELNANHSYQSITGQMKELARQKKQIEFTAKEGMSKAFDELASLKSSLETDKELLSEVAVGQFAEKKTVEVKKTMPGKHGPEEVTLVPKFSVKFGKV